MQAELDKMEKELSSNNKVILSSEQACETFRRLAVDKDAIIAQQKSIIDSYKSEDEDEQLAIYSRKLEDAKEVIINRDLNIENCNSRLHDKEEELAATLAVVEKISAELTKVNENYALLYEQASAYSSQLEMKENESRNWKMKTVWYSRGP